MENYKKMYKEALERARYYHSKDYMLINSAIENIFPELNESYSEKIKNELIEHIKANKEADFVLFKKFSPDDVITWLEKQGKQEQDPCEHCKDKCLNCHNFPCIEKRLFEQGKSALETINEEKVDDTNKVEPKFKVGDWILNNVCLPIKIISIEDGMYVFDDSSAMSISFIDENYHLWTIQDAKDGDILISSNKQPFMHNGNYTSNSVGAYFALTCTGEIIICGSSCYNNWTNLIGVHPATKEQRELLTKKMKEDGWKWDNEKKELKKVIYESADERIKYVIKSCVYASDITPEDRELTLAWLEKQGEKLDADEVIEWLRENIYISYNEPSTALLQRINKFKKDFRL